MTLSPTPTQLKQHARLPGSVTVSDCVLALGWLEARSPNSLGRRNWVCALALGGSNFKFKLTKSPIPHRKPPPQGLRRRKEVATARSLLDLMQDLAHVATKVGLGYGLGLRVS